MSTFIFNLIFISIFTIPKITIIYQICCFLGKRVWRPIHIQNKLSVHYMKVSQLHTRFQIYSASIMKESTPSTDTSPRDMILRTSVVSDPVSLLLNIELLFNIYFADIV